MAHPDREREITLTLTVQSEAAAVELDAAWRKIVSDQELNRTVEQRHGDLAIPERAQSALSRIETAIRENPNSGQARRLVQFVAGLYNGYDYPFDLTELRALDARLADACIDYLNYDRLGKREVDRHLSGGEKELRQWLMDYGIDPAYGRR
jgi:hypothetical protein